MYTVVLLSCVPCACFTQDCSIQVKDVNNALLEHHAQQVAVMLSVKGEIQNRINQRIIALERWFSSDIFARATATAREVEHLSRLVYENRRVIAELKHKISVERALTELTREKLSHGSRKRLPSKSTIVKNLNFQLTDVLSLLSGISGELGVRRSCLLRQLKVELYPIEFHGKFRSIRGLALPSGSGLKRYEATEEENVSTSLGYLVHRTDLVSRILDVPLKLDLVSSGSKSSIRDRFSVPSLHEFPLSMRAMERQRYLTGIQMLQDTLFHLAIHRGHKNEFSQDLLEIADSIIDRELHPNS